MAAHFFRLPEYIYIYILCVLLFWLYICVHTPYMYNCGKQTYMLVSNLIYCPTLLIKVPKPLESKYQHVIKCVLVVNINEILFIVIFLCMESYDWNASNNHGFQCLSIHVTQQYTIIYICVYIYIYSSGANLEHIVGMAHRTICRWPKPEPFQAIIYVEYTSYCINLYTVSCIRYYSTAIR